MVVDCNTPVMATSLVLTYSERVDSHVADLQ